jgi:hypothetical protein
MTFRLQNLFVRAHWFSEKSDFIPRYPQNNLCIGDVRFLREVKATKAAYLHNHRRRRHHHHHHHHHHRRIVIQNSAWLCRI